MSVKFFIICEVCGKSYKAKCLFIGGGEVHISNNHPCSNCVDKHIILEDYRICEYCGARTFIDDLTCRECNGIMVML